MNKRVDDSGNGDSAEDVFCSDEQKELDRRWPIALRELAALARRVRDISRGNPELLHQKLVDVEKKRLSESILKAILTDEQPELKRSVARRMANKMGEYLLWRRETSVPVIHELVVLLPWWISHLPGDVVPRIRDIGLNYVLNGRVVPLQTVWSDILSADPVYLGHCACRSAGIVDDLRQDGKIYNRVSEETGRQLLDRFVGRYKELKEKFGTLPDTDAVFTDLCEDLLRLKASDDAGYQLETLFERTYPHWEILPVHEKYTPAWVRSLHRNRKAHLIHKELVFELATIFYLARGTLFSSMKLFDTPYTICSCPTPENGGGCTLTNWYYFGGSNASLLPNEEVFGRRRDDEARLLPCKHFPVRARKECLGCGCQHEMDSLRSPEFILRQADAAYNAYRKSRD